MDYLKRAAVARQSKQLRDLGFSLRAIAGATGVSDFTVRKILIEEGITHPAVIHGRDGHKYASTAKGEVNQ